MTDPERNLIRPAPGYRSAEVGSFLEQMDDLSHRLGGDTRGVSPEALAWQPAPGMNTIGMLLAHLAIVEVYWTCWVLEDREPPIPCQEILGIGMDDDGMPLPEGSKPPAILAGKAFPFYDDLLERARAHLKAVAAGITDEALDREIQKRRSNRPAETYNRRWTLYHLLEHYAGHYGQILLLRHHYRYRAVAGRG